MALKPSSLQITFTNMTTYSVSWVEYHSAKIKADSSEEAEKIVNVLSTHKKNDTIEKVEDICATN